LGVNGILEYEVAEEIPEIPEILILRSQKGIPRRTPEQGRPRRESLTRREQ
jgi:hypothetical protein